MISVISVVIHVNELCVDRDKKQNNNTVVPFNHCVLLLYYSLFL